MVGGADGTQDVGVMRYGGGVFGGSEERSREALLCSASYEEWRMGREACRWCVFFVIMGIGALEG